MTATDMSGRPARYLLKMSGKGGRGLYLMMRDVYVPVGYGHVH